MRPCKLCGDPIHFIKTTAGNQMPCEPRIITIITESEKIREGYIPHWDKCPGADEVRKKVSADQRSHATNQLHLPI